MIGCKVDRESIKTGIEQSVLKTAINTGKFTQITPTLLKPITRMEDVKETIGDINRQWQDIVLQIQGDNVLITPTEDLINQGLTQANKDGTNDTRIDYKLKATHYILQNYNTVEKWWRTIADKDIFWRKLQQDLHIPLEQVQLLRESEGDTIQEKIVSFEANYAYTVELKTSINKNVHPSMEEFNEKGLTFKAEEKPSQTYQYLSAPGGTNYKEKAIRVPDITNISHSHTSDFSEGKSDMLGWVRVDDKYTSRYEKDDKNPKVDKLIIDTTTKILRVQEIQSNLFQKNRGKELTDISQYDPDELSILKPKEVKQNSFLQLLAKDNVWVTFFVKTIMQDSAKNGYERVWFPSGNTAAKIEGHESMPEFIKGREGLVTKAQEEIERLNKVEDNSIKKGAIADQERLIKLHQDEIKQAQAGTLSIGAIHDFYEKTVFNILQKKGYAPERVTDENGQEWYEVPVTDDQVEQILLYNPKDAILERAQWDETYLYGLLGMEKGDGVLDFIQKFSPDQEQIQKFLAANPGVQFYFGERAEFDYGKNKIIISPRQAYAQMRGTGLTLKQTLNAQILHEITHAALFYALEKEENRAELQGILDQAVAAHKSRPFEDRMRMGFVGEDGLPYPLGDVEEFASDALSNPYFMQWLQRIPDTSGKRTLWQRLRDFIRRLLGLKAIDSVYDKVLDFVNSEKIQRDNLEQLLNTQNKERVGSRYANPDWVDATYKYFTENQEIKGKLDPVLKDLPKAIARLKEVAKLQKDPEQLKRIRSLIEAYDDVKGSDRTIAVYVKMMVTAAEITRDLNNQLAAASLMEDDIKKIYALSSIMTAAHNLQFIVPLVRQVVFIMDADKYNANVNSFVTQLRGILSVENSIKENFINAVTPAVENYFSSLFPGNVLAKQIRENIERLNTNLAQSDISDKDKAKWTEMIRREEVKLGKIPTSETFKKIFAGKFEDASLLQMWLESPAVNSHPLIGGIVKWLREIDTEVRASMISVENMHQRRLTKIAKSQKLGMSTAAKTWASISDIVEDIVSVAENENGDIVPEKMKRRMFNSSYLPEYLSTQFMFRETSSFYYNKYQDAKRDNNELDTDKYWAKYEDILAKKMAWQKLNSERKYKDEVYDMFALLDKKVEYTDEKTGEKRVTSFRKERRDIFHEIEDLEHSRDAATNLQESAKYQDQIKELEIELKQIRSVWDKNGDLKLQKDMEISNIANQYYELRGQYGEHVLTDEGKASFERAKLDLEEKLKRNQITQEVYDAAMGGITTTELAQEYYDKIDEYDALILKATKVILANEELAPLMGDIDEQKLGEGGYKKIRDMVNGFRDPDGVIDGVLFSRARPQLIKEIKEIQEANEELKNKASKLKGLSVNDTILYESLAKKRTEGGLDDQEQAQFDDLTNEKARIWDIYKRNQKDVDAYYNALSGKSALMDFTPSEYYIQEKDTQLNKLINQLKPGIEQEVAKSKVLEDGTYKKEGNRWTKLATENVETIQRTYIYMENSDTYTDTQRVIDEIAKSRATAGLEETQWWKDNHFMQYKRDSQYEPYYPTEKPIYIWVHMAPKNKEYVKAGQPSYKFKTFQFHDGTKVGKPNMFNPNHKEIMPYIPINKADKFRNERYFDLQKNNKEMFDYMEFLRSGFREAQKFYPDTVYLGDLFSGMPQTKGERMDQNVRHMLQASTYKSIFERDVTASENQDVQQLLGGSQTKYYSENKVLPTRFTGRIEADKQTANVPGMVLSFILATRKYTKLQEVLPVLEATRTVVSNLGVKENINLSNKLGVLANLAAVIKGTVKTKEQDKVTQSSNLAKTMNFVLDTFVYGQTKFSAVSKIGGITIDWQKLSSDMRHLSSLSIFSFNTMVAFKNTVSAKVQGVIFANYGAGFYTPTDFAWANWETKKYLADHIKDYKKFGDKSLIGQQLTLFQVLNGTSYDAYGKKTEWTNWKNWENWFTVIKNSSEFELQVTQFLAMSRANKVMVNGKLEDFKDAYELDKDGNIALKEGAEVTKKMKDDFIGRVIHINRNINGAYRQDDLTYVQKTVLGGMAFYLNGFVMPGIVSRFGGLRYSIEAETFTRGSWSQTGQFIKDLISYRRGLSKEWKDLDSQEKGRVMRFVRELGFVVGFMVLVGALGGGDDKKELAKHIALQNYMLALAMAVKSETETFTPLPSMGLNELSRKINSPFAALKQITTILKTVQSAFDFVAQNSNAYYKATGIHDGFHDKGDPKVVANFLKIIGWSGGPFLPSIERVIKGRQIQQIR